MTGNVPTWGGIFCAGFLLPTLFLGQQDPAHPNKSLTPEQQAYREYEAKHRTLKAKANQLFDTEMLREKAGDCHAAQTDSDFNACYGKELAITDQNLKNFEGLFVS